MNNRIFEIIQDLNGRVGLQWTEADKEELAELIVRECARLAMTQHCSTSPADYGNMEPYQQGCDDTASAISGLIRRTFGVEE